MNAKTSSTAGQSSEPARDSAASRDFRELARWRRMLLPLMSILLVGCAIFFAAVSVIEYDRMNRSFAVLQGTAAVAGPDGKPAEPPSIAFANRLLSETRQPPPASFEQRLALDRFRTEIALEHHTITLRYGQAAQNIMGRLWTRLMGFVTGMILALVGAAFILGRLDDAGSQLSVEHASLKGALTSSSPGIVLAVLGSTLMIVSIFVTTHNETRDGVIYLDSAQRGAGRPQPQMAPPNKALDAMKGNMTEPGNSR